jgi:hypothetical protein
MYHPPLRLEAWKAIDADVALGFKLGKKTLNRQSVKCEPFVEEEFRPRRSCRAS